MCKSSDYYETSKIVVDFYNPQQDGRLICSCYTPGASAQVEPEYLVKTVTPEELKDLVADDDGRVFVTISLEEARYISFQEYYQELDEASIMRYCEIIINKRENRTHLFFQSQKTA